MGETGGGRAAGSGGERQGYGKAIWPFSGNRDLRRRTGTNYVKTAGFFFVPEIFWILSAGSAGRKIFRVFAGENFSGKYFKIYLWYRTDIFCSMTACLPFVKNRRRSVRAAVALALLLVVIFGVAEAADIHRKNVTPAEFSLYIFKNTDSNETADIIQHYLYEQNLTFWQKKLDSEILELIDPDYPRFGLHPITNESIRAQMISIEKNLIPAEQVPEMMGIGQPKGDLIWVTIFTDSETSAAGISPYLVRETSHGGRIINVWIYVDDIQAIASLPTVRAIERHSLPKFSNYSSSMIPNMLSEMTNIPVTEYQIQSTPEYSSANSSQKQVLVSGSSHTVSPSFSEFAAASAFLIIGLLIQRKQK